MVAEKFTDNQGDKLLWIVNYSKKPMGCDNQLAIWGNCPAGECPNPHAGLQIAVWSSYDWWRHTDSLSLVIPQGQYWI